MIGNDPFSDVEGDIDGHRGVLDSDAFTNHEKVTDKIDPSGAGWSFKCNCQHCNRPSIITVPWPELIVCSVGVQPLDMDSRRPWIVQNGFMYPPVTCGSCGNLLTMVGITPHKAQRCLAAGVQAGKIQGSYVQQQQQATLQQAAHLRR